MVQARPLTWPALVMSEQLLLSLTPLVVSLSRGQSVSICTFVPAEERPVSLALMQGNHLIEEGLTHQTLLLSTVERGEGMLSV